MCFTEFLGYTCGHTSIPVQRPCPMTTQSHVNRICPLPACRPLLAATMCPSCARIVHGRWVNIIVHEHEFMHARGVCHCPVRFPHLQQPRVVSHYYADVVEDVEGAGREAFAAHFRDRARARSETMTSQASTSSSTATDAKSSGTDSSSATVILAPIVKREPSSSDSPRESFHFSPSAAEFTPAVPATASSHLSHGPLPSINEIFGMPADFDFGMSGLDLGQSNVGPAKFEPHGHPADNKGKNKGKGKGHGTSKGKGKGKGKHKEVSVEKERGGGSDFSYRTHHYNNDNFQPQQYVRGESTASSATMASSATATSGGSNLPPMFEAKEGPDSKMEIATRLMSQYGAEWIAEHGERHQAGECDCRCSFDKYPAQYAPMLEEMMPEDIENEMSNDEFADFSFSYEFAPKYEEQHESSPFGVHVSHRDDSLPYGTPGFHSDGYVPAPTNTPAEPSAQNPYPYSGKFDEELSQAMRHHFPPVSSVPTQATPGPAHFPPAPAPTQSPYDAHTWKIHIPPDPTTPSFPRGYQPSSFGEPARWACAPPNSSYTNDGNTQGSTMPTPRPVDMQVIAYDVTDIPIVGLPIGAGPEGDSHMPPFEDCELYYPKIHHDHRHATL